MISPFHRNLNRMTLFIALVIAGVVLFFDPFMQIATANIWLNGIIIGTAIFGIGLCFIQMFRLLPEHRWLYNYIAGKRGDALPPRVLRPAALMLGVRPTRISATALNSMLDMVSINLMILSRSQHLLKSRKRRKSKENVLRKKGRMLLIGLN